jgi:hypothetical protein
MAKRTYRVRLSRSILSTACLTVEASSRNEALFLAGGIKLEESEWENDASKPAIDSVEIVNGEGE